MAKKNSKLRLDVQLGLHDLPISALGPASGHEFVKAYFPLAKTVLRIATGYFSVKGYDIGLEHLATPDVLLHFLVGPNEGANVRDAVAKRIRAELRGGDSGNLVAAVEDLIQRIREGKFVIQDAREVSQLFHCKFYMCDERYVWHGSANFSEKGLLKQAEQVEASTNADLIQRWRIWFEEVASQSRNLMDDVLTELVGWLKLADPFDAYLKALLVLFGLSETPYCRGAHQPTYYQKALVARALRHLANYRGSLLVVATGLGKTVIGAEIAGQLHRVRACDSILLIAPPTVHRAWKKQLVLTRKLPAQIFGCNALFNKIEGKAHHAASELAEQLQNADSKTLIIIDEAQYYRNELLSLTTKQRSEVYQRLQPALAQQAQIVLLTGSVYGTSIQNVNSLLRLLPSRPATDPNELAVPWKVDTCEELTQLPLVSVLGIPHVLKMARLRKDVDAEQHPFIEFTNKQQRIEKNYLPRIIRSRLVAYRPPLRDQVLRVIDGKCCDQNKPRPTKNYDDEAGEYVDRLTNSALNQAIYSWLSSPLAFVHRLQKNLQTPGKHDEQTQLIFNAHVAPAATATQGTLELGLTPRIITAGTANKHRQKAVADRHKGDMKLNRQKRQEHLGPLLEKLTSDYTAQDDKLNKLKQIIDDRCRVAKSKVLIFVELYDTAVYLEKHLTKQFGALVRVACTVVKKGRAFYLKSLPLRRHLQGRFAPKANEQPEPGDYEVLICTDADGIGVNLQDADTVINYDLTGGADALVQRLGRILRPTTDPARMPHLYTFVPDWNDTPVSSRTRISVEKRFARFRARSDKSDTVLKTKILGTLPEEEMRLDQDLDIEAFMTQADSLASVLGATSTAAHIATLQAHHSRATDLAESVMSARRFAGTAALVVVIFDVKDHMQPVSLVFKPNPNGGMIFSEEEDEALRLLACSTEAPLELVTPGLIRREETAALTCWCEKHNVELKHTSHLVTLYLVPEKESGEYSKFMNSTVVKKRRSHRQQ